MKDSIEHISFKNKTNPKSFLDVVAIEELLERKLDHDIFKNHIVDFYIIVFITAGNGYHTIDFVDYKYQKGTVLLIRKDQIHKFFRSTNVNGFLLIFTEEFIVSHLNKLEATKTIQLFNDLLSFPKIELKMQDEEFIRFSSIVNQIEWEYKLKDEYSLGINRSALHILINKLFRIKSQKKEHLSSKKYLIEFLSFQEHVEKNCFHTKKVSIYAQEMGISTKTLNNIVQEVVNKPAKQFVDEIAIVKIKRLLIGTTDSVKEIAYSAGFDDPSNFFKYFKKNTGTTPEAFRKAHQ